MGGGKGSAPPPPDYTPIAAASSHAADKQYALGEDQLAWAKEQYASDRGVVNQVVDDFLQTQNTNNTNAQYDRARYQNTFQPLEDQLGVEANTYGSGARKNLEMGRAEANVGQAFDASRQAAQRQLEDFGVNPGATRFAALDVAAGAQKAAAQAAAGNQASEYVDATGRALRSEAINVGRGYPGQIAGTYNTALQAGSGAVNGTLAATASGANTMGSPTQYMGLGNQSLGTWENALTQGYNAQLAQFNANQHSSSGLGSLAGAIAGPLIGAMLADGGTVPGGPQQAVPLTRGPDGVYAPNTPQGNQPPPGAVPPQASPSGGRALDDVPARLTAGEFVVPKDVVQWEGEKGMQNLVQKARMARQKALQTTNAQPQMRPVKPQATTFVSQGAAQRALPV